MNSVSCAAPSKCTVGGYYTDGMGVRQAFVSAEWHGTWRTEYKALQGTPILNEGGHAQVESVSCGKPAFCTASGYYTDRSGHHQAFVARQVGAHWGNAIEAPGTAALNSGKRDGATIWSISCATAGRCTAGGRYTDHHSHSQAFLVELVDGSWSDAIKVPGTGTLNKGGAAGVRSASCATASNCTVGGYYSDKSSKRQAFVAEKTNGNWGTAVKLPGAATLNKGGNAEVTSVSCATAGYCTAGGFYTNGSHKREAFVANETAGIWHSAIKVRGTATSAEVESVSCATKSHCTAAGYYTDSHGHRQAIVARSAPTTSLNPGGTSCSGPYGGTGDHVVVPAGASCTLVPGTNVTHYVTVSKGGTLYAAGVKIGGVLTVSGSATVCQSRVLSDLKAVKPGGSLQLGGTDCGTGNTFSHNVVVSHDSHNLWIWQNTITGNLTVSYAHGKTNSIQSNSVHNLLVSHSGPVLVVDNHGKGNVSCTANKPQQGHGNKAKGKNTCPK